MKKRFTSSLALFLISGLVFFGVSALTLWLKLSNLKPASPKPSTVQPQASSTETNQVEKAQEKLTGPSWEYRNPKIGDLTTELNARLRALDEKENEEIDKTLNLFVSKLGIEEEVANNLINQGYSSLEELAYISDEEFDTVENIEPEILTQIRNKARDSLLLDAMLDDTEKSDTDAITSKTFSELDENVHNLLAEAKIKSLSELADLSIDELQEVCEIDEVAAIHAHHLVFIDCFRTIDA